MCVLLLNGGGNRIKSFSSTFSLLSTLFVLVPVLSGPTVHFDKNTGSLTVGFEVCLLEYKPVLSRLVVLYSLKHLSLCCVTSSGLFF